MRVEFMRVLEKENRIVKILLSLSCLRSALRVVGRNSWHLENGKSI